MPKILVRQQNKDGSETIVWKDSDAKDKVVLATGVSPWFSKIEVVNKDKMRSELRKLRNKE